MDHSLKVVIFLILNLSKIKIKMYLNIINGIKITHKAISLFYKHHIYQFLIINAYLFKFIHICQEKKNVLIKMKIPNKIHF